MDAQFEFFNSEKLKNKPAMASLNYFLTYGARGGDGDKLLGEKQDVKVWLGWLELWANGDVTAIESPIGFLPKYEDLKKLFDGINKDYPKSLYNMQFAIYVDNIVAKIDLQKEAFSTGESIPAKLFDLYENQKTELLALKEKFGAIVSVEQLIG
jgi:phosphoenolpyruvate carboxykinase (GTP)